MTNKKEGIENFIISRLSKAHSIDEIHSMLKNAGFSKDEIKKGFDNVKKKHRTIHQDIAAANGFMPKINKVNKGGSNIFYSIDESIKHLGLFAGRVRRKDFIVSFLFAFSVLFSLCIVIASLINSLYPERWLLINNLILNSSGVIFIYIPIIFAPFTLLFLSLITRRLHDLDLPGELSLLYFGLALYPFSIYCKVGFEALLIALSILFVLLLSKSGSSEENKYGKFPASHGSTFKKILNLK